MSSSSRQRAQQWGASVRTRTSAIFASRKTRLGLVLTATTVIAAVLGVLGGYLARGDPTASEEYQDLSSLHDELTTDHDDLSQHHGELSRRVEEFEGQAEDFEDQEAELDERETELDEREAQVSETEDRIAESTFAGDGTFLVGVDIEPGTYRSSPDREGRSCYWERLSGTDSDSSSRITNGSSRGEEIVTIQSSDTAFRTSGCTDWTQVD